MDGERVDAAFELTNKCFIDHSVALKPALPAERLRHNMHPEMSLPALPVCRSDSSTTSRLAGAKALVNFSAMRSRLAMAST
jgi:hypothetical protein